MFTSSRSWGQGRPRERCCPGSRGSGDAQRVARAISVLGEGAEIAVAAGLAELDATAFAAATRELVRAEILRSESPLGFVHPLVQAAVYSDLAPGERGCTTNARPRFSSGSAP